MMKKKKFGQVLALLILEAFYIMLQIALAVNYLYESGMMHCALKVSNDLVNIVEDQDAYISLSSLQVKLNHCCLKIEAAQFWVQPYHWWVQTQWRAPQVFEDEENRDKDTKSSGVYSF
jgi:serine/threonine protein kinase